MKVYLAGPMRGVADFGQKFTEAAADLRARGIEVISAYEIELTDEKYLSLLRSDNVTLDDIAKGTMGKNAFRYAIHRDVGLILRCDAVVVMSGWTQSDGAGVEVHFAMACGIPILGMDLEPVDAALMKRFKKRGLEDESPTGMRRSSRKGRGRFDLMPWRALYRLAQWFEAGAKDENYGTRNWERGDYISRYYDSAMRHGGAVGAGRDNEPHILAMAWNALCLIDTIERVKEGLLPAELLDMEPVPVVSRKDDSLTYP